MLGHQLAVDVCSRVIGPASAGDAPGGVMAAVLGERRRREEASARSGSPPGADVRALTDASPYVRPLAPASAAPPAPPEDGFHLPR